DEARELAIRERECERLVLVERLVAALALVAVRRHDLVVALGPDALELSAEGAVAQLEELPIVSEDVVNSLVLARQRVVPRRAVDGVGCIERSKGVHVALAECLVTLSDDLLVGVCHVLLLFGCPSA